VVLEVIPNHKIFDVPKPFVQCGFQLRARHRAFVRISEYLRNAVAVVHGDFRQTLAASDY
jgi:hypothetical protein